LLVAGGATAEPSVGSKQAEAQQVLAQIQELDGSLSHAIEAYNLANVKLDRIRNEQRSNAQRLTIARRNLGVARQTLEQRLVALYTSDESSGSTLEVVLGATSIDDLLNRLETIDRVSDQDAGVVARVTAFGREVAKQKAQLARANAEQQQVVSARAAQRASIERQLAERQRLLSSIRAEIARIQAAERARQARIAAAARARIATQIQTVEDPTGTEAAQAVVGAVAATAEGTTAVAPARYGGVVGIAMQYLGIPYRWGGSSPSGFDCSGFVMYVYSKVGVSLPHNAAAQYGYGTPVSKDQLAPGDIVFFNGLGHNGLYIGGGQFVHAPHTGDVVKVSSLSDSWYAATYVGGRRL
jgi:cell wall-associated NlpC family hydrolase